MFKIHLHAHVRPEQGQRFKAGVKEETDCSAINFVEEDHEVKGQVAEGSNDIGVEKSGGGHDKSKEENDEGSNHD